MRPVCYFYFAIFFIIHVRTLPNAEDESLSSIMNCKDLKSRLMPFIHLKKVD